MDIQVERPSLSPAATLVSSQGWDSKPSGTDQLVAPCPLCHQGEKFYINVSNEEKDGLWECKRCNESGNLYQLKVKLGILNQNIVSFKDTPQPNQAPLPDVSGAHWRLMNDARAEHVHEYLFHERKFSLAVLERFKIGAAEHSGMWWILYPYYDKGGNLVYVKQRSAPPAKKAFMGVSGREQPLFNAAALKPDMGRVFLVEGEADALAMLSNNFEETLGVPGAAMKKATWITELDKAAPKQIYLLYDSDKVGQESARKMAERIGLEKVKNIVLPSFTKEDGSPGKDINEWFIAGHTAEDLEVLIAEARQFDVLGIQSVMDVLDEIEEELGRPEAEQSGYLSPWPSLTKVLGPCQPGDMVGILADGKIGKTTLTMNWLDYLAEQGETVLLHCGEMKPSRLVKKWISFKTSTPDKDITAVHVQSAREMAKQTPGEFLFGYFNPAAGSVAALETIRQAVRRYGAKVVVLDNLYLLCRSIENERTELSKISKDIKGLAMELNIVVLLVLQPRKVGEGRIVNAADIMGSSSISKDVDSLIVLHRNPKMQMNQDDFANRGVVEETESHDPFMMCNVALSRYSSGGITTLYMDGAVSTIREMTATDQKQLTTEPVVIQVETKEYIAA